MRRVDNSARNAAILRMADSASYGEIATEFGMTRSAVCGVVHREAMRRKAIEDRAKRLQIAKDRLASRGIVVAPL